MKLPGTFTCPACGYGDQRFNYFFITKQVVRAECKKCKRIIASDIGFFKNLLVHIVVAILTYNHAIPLLFALYLGYFYGVVFGIVAFIFYIVLITIPWAIWHSRHVELEK